ncbi:hypothetical protein [Nannocystis punicea]|uniref:Protein kinase domain-containing protein n=1 Tax=Nannocystis punicea TaxID=2995304 RepID=A0ABY7H041_9BACT|nr:hypothetical protein [Nannocystis poenicansa]WAS92394.1 hypothetical protein O0S08_39955 [Nannocystis poenicansa]
MIERGSGAPDRLSTDVPDDDGPGEREAPGGGEARKFGRFRLLRLLGPGGMGVMRAAYDGQLDRAPKRVHGDRNTAVIGRFIREVKALAEMSRPTGVQSFDASALRRSVFRAMELREETAVRRREGGFEASVGLFFQAGRRASAVHAAGLVRRDFRSDDVRVGDDGRARVMDVGPARATEGPPSVSSVPVAADEPRGEVERTAVVRRSARGRACRLLHREAGVEGALPPRGHALGRRFSGPFASR